MVKKTLILFFGASSGIGQKLINLLNKKYKVICFYNKNKIKVKKGIELKKIDFLKQNEINKISAIKTLQNHNIVILNFATIKIDKLSIYVVDKEFRKTVDINVKSFLQIINTIIPYMMKKNWGRIINISSAGGSKGDKGTLLYSISKNASETMMNVMAKEYGKFDITFNNLKLGNFDYGLFKKFDINLKKKLLNKVPSKKTGDVKNIFFAIEFLIKSDYINGSSISIDGGSE